MRWSEVRWGTVLGLAVLAEVLLIAAAVLYMVVYGNVFNPGHAEDFYQRHARVARPWVSMVAGIAIFFLLARWVRYVETLAQ